MFDAWHTAALDIHEFHDGVRERGDWHLFDVEAEANPASMIRVA